MSKDFKVLVTAGFAMFSMFFGSGNLVFPLLIGVRSLDGYCWATLGLLLTAVVVPFIGLIGVVLYHGSRHAYFGALGERTTFFLTLIILALLGPFGVVPRCITVAYGGFELMFPSFPGWLFSVIFCGLMALLIWVRHRIVPLIGQVITPWLMVGVFGVIVLGLLQGNSIDASGIAAFSAFNIGLIKGYHTVDLLAGFFFATTTVYYLKAYASAQDDPRKLIKMSLGASCIGAGLLATVYVGFVALGAQYAPALDSVPPNDYLAVIAGQALGSFAVPVVAITIALACLTTGAILSALFSDFIFQDVANRKLKREGAIIVTLITSFAVSLLGFTTISEWLGVILEVIYPALIALAIANLIQLRSQANWGRPCFWATLTLSLFIKFFG